MFVKAFAYKIVWNNKILGFQGSYQMCVVEKRQPQATTPPPPPQIQIESDLMIKFALGAPSIDGLVAEIETQKLPV